MAPTAPIKEETASPRRGAAPKRSGEGEELLALADLKAEDVFRKLESAAEGLEPAQAARRLEEFGPNEAGGAPREGLFLGLARRAKNPLVVQLLVIAGISLAMGDRPSALIVGAMVILSVALAYIQESRSGRAVEKLLALVKTTCTILRAGREEEVALADLVPGDVVILAAGSIIPADLRLVAAKDFFVSQSALTGESMPVEKTAAPCDAAGKTALELPNSCFQGCNVLSGTARGVVAATGARTYFGSISRKIFGARSLTSFEQGIKSFTWLMIRFMIVMVAVVFLIVGITKGNWIEALLFALAVAVGLTPEMLPMIVTVNLSKGAIVMSRQKVIVKRLNSIQNFGAMNILCTDKTGTLTQDRVVLERHVDVANRESDDVLRYAYMNSYYQTGLRNLLDRAILAHSDLDVERTCRKVDEIPFDFSRRRMSVVIDYEGDHVLVCKGAVEEVFSACSRYQIDDEVYPLIDMIKLDLLEEYEALSAQGYRVLAVAYREFERSKEVFASCDERDMTLLGYVAFFDPPKDSATEALRALKKAGVDVKILTGDSALVTRKICRDVGLEAAEIVTGDKLRGLSDEELARTAERAMVFAKLSPAQKDGIIRALRGRGHVVGFLGDGINDAPAMKTADVGISVDTAVDVAKESADIILLEKSLLVLEDGIIEGRRVFGNIVKYIKMGASSNFGNMFSMTGSALLFPFLPMMPIQILVNNLLYDFSQLGIPLDRVDDEYLVRPRKWNIDNIKKFMVWIGPMSSIFDYTTFALLWFFYHCSAYSAPGALPAVKEHARKLFQTGWFVESILTQTLIVHIIRTRRIPFVQSVASPGLIATTLLVMAAGAFLPFSPAAKYLGMTPLPGSFWPWIIATLLCYAVLTHGMKTYFIRKYGTD
ncbi:MAG TPA: magnesium-translocating P-type ATPase [Elusimicrobiota bacterium]|nr:magnesium-translocating P-type ATPase [Elusimicrobiota bacterium]